MIRSATIALALLGTPAVLLLAEGEGERIPAWAWPDLLGPKTGAEADTVRYTVDRGQTLSGLAELHYGDPGAWRAIYEANRDVLDHPDRVRAGQELLIPPTFAVEGRAHARERAGELRPAPEEEEIRGRAEVRGVTVRTDDDERVAVRQDPSTSVDRRRAHRTRAFEPAPPPPFPEDRMRTVFYYQRADHRPEPEVIGVEEELWSDVPGGAHAAAGWLEPSGDHPDRLGYVSEFAGDQDVRLGRTAVHLYDDLRVILETDAHVEEGDHLLLYRTEYRPGGSDALPRFVRDAIYGDEGLTWVMPTGVLEVERIVPAGVVGRVMSEFHQVRLGDRVAPYRSFATRPGTRSEEVDPGEALEGTLMGFERERQLVQLGDRGYIDLGERDGVRPGDEFVALAGDDDGWGGGPVARLQVVRTQRDAATVRVLAIHATTLQEGLTVRQVRRMP